MQSQNRFLDDLAKMLNGAAGTIAGVGREAEAGMRERIREFAGGMDFVSREEFDAVKQMAAKAREEIELLKARLDAQTGPGQSGTATSGTAASTPMSTGAPIAPPAPAAMDITATETAATAADRAGLDPDAD